jgi:hypothetical protein
MALLVGRGDGGGYVAVSDQILAIHSLARTVANLVNAVMAPLPGDVSYPAGLDRSGPPYYVFTVDPDRFLAGVSRLGGDVVSAAAQRQPETDGPVRRIEDDEF